MRKLALACVTVLALVGTDTIQSVAPEWNLPAWDEQPRDAPLSFAMGNYDQVHSLSVDPKLLWHTFFGSSGEDRGYGVAVDGSGNIYVTGWSAVTWGDPILDHSGDPDAFVAKFNSDGALQWNTFLGGADDDYGAAIVVDEAGETIYVSGESYAAWGEPIVPFVGQQHEVFVAKLNGQGTLQWLTFMGSDQSDRQSLHGGLEVDDSGNVYVHGWSYATWGSPINPFAGMTDAFVAKLSASGARQWNTFMGATDGNDASCDIALDTSGNVYVLGWSGASWGTPVNPIDTFGDVFLAKLNTNGIYQWNTFLGGEGEDVSYGGIDLDVNTGKVYVAGRSNSEWGTPIEPYVGGIDAFVAQLDSTTGSRQWHTFFGSDGEDYAYAVAVSGNGDIYVTGFSGLTWGDPVWPHSGEEDAFLVQLSPDGARQRHLFLGGTEDDRGYDIIVEPSGERVDVIGYSDASWGEPLSSFQGVRDAFLAKIDLTVTALISVSVAGPETGWVNTSYPFTATVSPISATMPITYVWQATSQGTVTHTGSFSDSVSFSWVAAGSKDILVAATNVSGTVTDSHTISISMHECCLPVALKDFFCYWCDQYEPNDSRPKNGGSPPGPFTSGQTIQAQICSGDPRDLYYADLTAGKTAIFTLTNMPSNVNFDLYLWDENSDIPKAKSEKGTGQDEKITYAVPVTGRYYVDVYPKQGTGAYSLRYQ